MPPLPKHVHHNIDVNILCDIQGFESWSCEEERGEVVVGHPSHTIQNEVHERGEVEGGGVEHPTGGT